jgi:hypothetical protein
MVISPVAMSVSRVANVGFFVRGGLSGVIAMEKMLALGDMLRQVTKVWDGGR